MLRLYANTTSIRNQVSFDFVISGGMGIPENILLKKRTISALAIALLNISGWMGNTNCCLSVGMDRIGGLG